MEKRYVCPSSIDEWFDRELERCQKAFEQGNKGALLDALSYCRKYKKPCPRWITENLTSVYTQSLIGSVRKKRGRNANWLTQYEQDMIDFIRADTVQECIEHDIRWIDVYGAVSWLLTGTIAGGSEDTIEASYKRCKKRIKTEPFRYMILKSCVFKNSIHKPLTKYVDKMRKGKSRKDFLKNLKISRLKS